VRAVVQLVSSASVKVGDEEVASIGRGFLVLLGVGHEDAEADSRRLAAKVAKLRVFPDSGGKMNLSVSDAGGSVLVVSQFTLYGDVRKGNRPSFAAAAPPEAAEPLVASFASELDSLGIDVATGSFGARMTVSLVNEGPVTIIL
jgi:D-tyrosyl-tRNA(Tyr) deacylase